MYFNILLFEFEWSYLGCYKHGLNLISSDTATKYCFRGNRLPWTIIFDARRAVMRLRAILPRRITLFYSLNKINWLFNFSHQLYVYLDKSYHIPFFSPTHVFDIKIYSLFVRSHPMDRIVFIIIVFIHLPFSISLYAPQNKGQICFLTFNMFIYYLRLNIAYFVYKGPRSVYGLDDCEYGWLFID